MAQFYVIVRYLSRPPFFSQISQAITVTGSCVPMMRFLKPNHFFSPVALVDRNTQWFQFLGQVSDNLDLRSHRRGVRHGKTLVSVDTAITCLSHSCDTSGQ